MCFSPDGKTVLCADGGNGLHTADTAATLWSLETGEPTGMRFETAGEADAIAFSPDGKTVATGDRASVAQIWNVATGNRVGHPMKHEDWVLNIDYNYDGSLLVSGSKDGELKLWNADLGVQIGSLSHKGIVARSVAFLPNRNTLFSASDDRAVVWNVIPPVGAEPASLIHVGAPVELVAFAEDGLQIVAGSGTDQDLATWDAGIIKVWDSTSGQLLYDFSESAIPAHSADISSDGGTIVSVDPTGKCVLKNTSTSKLLAQPIDTYMVSEDIALHPDKDRFLFVPDSSTAQLWSFATGKKIGEPMPHPDPCRSSDFSPDGTIFATACWDGLVRLWDTNSSQPTGNPINCGGQLSCVNFSPDGNLIAVTSGSSKTASIWDVNSGERISGPLNHNYRVDRVAFSPDGEFLATASGAWEETRPGEASVILWDIRTGRMLAEWEHPHHVSSVAFHPNGKSLASACYDGNVRVWQLPTPVQGEAEQIRVWVEVITGTTWQSSGVVRFLDTKTFAERRARLEELGGAPVATDREDTWTTH